MARNLTQSSQNARPTRRDKAPKKVTKNPKEITTHTIEKEGIVVGRDKKVIHPEEVRKLAALGCTKLDIANYLGITNDTLIYNFTDAYIMGTEQMKIELRRAMFENAITYRNPALQIWLSKNLLAMKDNPTDTEDNKPLPWNDSF